MLLHGCKNIEVVKQTIGMSKRSSGKDVIHIAFAIDDAYVRQTITAIHSIIRTSSSPIAIHIIFTCLSNESQSILRDVIHSRGARLRFYPVESSWLGSFPDSAIYSKATYLRLRLPELLSELPKCLYLDPDILVRHDIIELWNWPMDGHAVAAVKDIDVQWTKEHRDRIRLPEAHIYFNAGVMVLDLSKLRDLRFEEAALRFASDEPERIEIVDQDILNILLANKVSYLPLRWNYCPLWIDDGTPGRFSWRNVQSYYDEAERRQADGNPALVHFANIHKPWHATFEAIDHPFQAEYRQWDQQAHPSGFVNRQTTQPKISCIVPIHDTDESACGTAASLIRQTAPGIEIIVVTTVGDRRISAILETGAQWTPHFRYAYLENSTPAKSLLCALRLVTADRVVFVPPGTILDQSFFSRCAESPIQTDADPKCSPHPETWTNESWWRIIMESEAARRAAERVCRLVDGCLCFYFTILQVLADEPDKAEVHTAAGRAWDARQKPQLRAKDALEFKRFFGSSRRGCSWMHAPMMVRSLFNCFRYLEPREKLKFVAGLATLQPRARAGEQSA